MTDGGEEAADYIIEEAIGTLQLGGRVRVYFPGGPLDPISIEHCKGGRYVDFEVAPGKWVKIVAASVVGWQDLDEFDEATQRYKPS